LWERLASMKRKIGKPISQRIEITTPDRCHPLIDASPAQRNDSVVIRICRDRALATAL